MFSWIGRLTAPLFLFCFVEGFIHTHDRKKYFLRIYLLSIVMGAIQFGFYNILSPAVRGDGFFPQNAMLSSFAILFDVNTLFFEAYDWLGVFSALFMLYYNGDSRDSINAIINNSERIARSILDILNRS